MKRVRAKQIGELVAFLSVTYMARVYAKMRGGNLTERARQEAMQMGAQMAAHEMARKHQTGGP